MERAQVTVQIMLGGRSVRMGRDKALVCLSGKTLLERAVERWSGYGGAFQLSVGPASRAALAPAGVETVADVYPERGPLGGLHWPGGGLYRGVRGGFSAVQMAADGSQSAHPR